MSENDKNKKPANISCSGTPSPTEARRPRKPVVQVLSLVRRYWPVVVVTIVGTLFVVDRLDSPRLKRIEEDIKSIKVSMVRMDKKGVLHTRDENDKIVCEYDIAEEVQRMIDASLVRYSSSDGYVYAFRSERGAPVYTLLDLNKDKDGAYVEGLTLMAKSSQLPEAEFLKVVGSRYAGLPQETLEARLRKMQAEIKSMPDRPLVYERRE